MLTTRTVPPAVGAHLSAARALAGTRPTAGEPAAREATAALEHARACGDRDALSSFRELRALVGPAGGLLTRILLHRSTPSVTEGASEDARTAG